MFPYNVSLHAGQCLNGHTEGRPTQHSNNNAKYLSVPNSAKSYKRPNSSEDSTSLEMSLIESNGSKRSSFTEVGHSDNQEEFGENERISL